jgi:cell division protein FtsB
MKSLWGQGTRYLRVTRRSIDVSPKVAKLLLALVIVLISIIFISGNVGLWNLWRAQKEIKDLSDRIEMLEKRNALLSVEIERLKSDPYTVEKILREKYGYVRDGDKVYRLTPFSDDGARGIDAPSLLDTRSENP